MLHRGKLPRNEAVLLRMLDELTAFLRNWTREKPDPSGPGPESLVLSGDHVGNPDDPNESPDELAERIKHPPRPIDFKVYIVRCRRLVRAIVARIDGATFSYDPERPQSPEDKRGWVCVGLAIQQMNDCEIEVHLNKYADLCGWEKVNRKQIPGILEAAAKRFGVPKADLRPKDQKPKGGKKPTAPKGRQTRAKPRPKTGK